MEGSGTKLDTITSSGLSAELRAVQDAHTGWHTWHSDGGWAYATHIYTPAESAAIGAEAFRLGGPSEPAPPGVTLDAPTPALLHHAIAVHEHWLSAA